jgi:hypothetical protein
MDQQRYEASAGSRTRLVIIEVVLLVTALWVLIWRPLGQNISLIVAIMLALFFIGLFPAMLKGNRVEVAEREHLARRYSNSDNNNER